MWICGLRPSVSESHDPFVSRIPVFMGLSTHLVGKRKRNYVIGTLESMQLLDIEHGPSKRKVLASLTRENFPVSIVHI